MRRVLACAAGLFFIAAAAMGVYLSAYYHSGAMAEEIMEKPSENVTITVQDKEYIVFQGEAPEIGLIFYPGAKVEYTAYAPLMDAIAENNVFCALVHMPANMAFFDLDAAERVREEHPEIRRWYLAGHSLGGAIAGNYLGEHTSEYEGLILLAAYTTEDLSDTELRVLSIYGSEDGVFNLEAYEKYLDNLPASLREIVIDGACHANFGDYGIQKGDKEPRITRQEQILETARLMTEFMER